MHLIQESSGTVMAGDWAGPFGPGHLSLMGSFLPHNWISHRDDSAVVRNRDAVLQFDQERFFAAAGTLPELEALRPLLDAAARGIEFTGRTAVQGAEAMEAVNGTFGLRRLAAVAELLAVLPSPRRASAATWTAAAAATAWTPPRPRSSTGR